MANEDMHERLNDDPTVFIDKAKIYRQNNPIAAAQSEPTIKPSPKVQTQPIKPAFDINTRTPERRRILETLDLLEQELQAEKQIRNRGDERIRILLKQFKDARWKFEQFGNDARFSSSPTDLQRDIDECRSIVAVATAELTILLPILKPEWERQWKQEQERQARKKQLHLEQMQQEQEEKEQERRHKDRLNEELRAKLRAKSEATRYQRVKPASSPPQPQFEPASPTPSGTGCIVLVLGIVAFIAVSPFLVQLLRVVVLAIIGY